MDMAEEQAVGPGRHGRERFGHGVDRNANPAIRRHTPYDVRPKACLPEMNAGAGDRKRDINAIVDDQHGAAPGGKQRRALREVIQRARAKLGKAENDLVDAATETCRQRGERDVGGHLGIGDKDETTSATRCIHACHATTSRGIRDTVNEKRRASGME
jgi:hypothetical protein